MPLPPPPSTSQFFLLIPQFPFLFSRQFLGNLICTKKTFLPTHTLFLSHLHQNLFTFHNAIHEGTAASAAAAATTTRCRRERAFRRSGEWVLCMALNTVFIMIIISSNIGTITSASTAWEWNPGVYIVYRFSCSCCGMHTRNYKMEGEKRVSLYQIFSAGWHIACCSNF